MVNILLRYLGIKTKLLEPIKSAIDHITPEDGAVLDLFAGSNTVAQYLMKDYTVFTNDCQHYSYAAARALIEPHAPNTIARISADCVFNPYYEENRAALEALFSEPLEKEKALLDAIGEQYYGPAFDAFRDFFDHSAYCGDTKEKHSSFDHCLTYFSEDFLKEYRENPKRFPYLLFTTFYNNPYFSLRQCVEIDCIRYALDKALEMHDITEEEYYIYLSFLIYSLNLIVISVGDHFAQPQKIKEVSEDFSGPRDRINLRERKKIIGKKRLSVRELYEEKLRDYVAHYTCGRPGNKAFLSDFKDLLSSPYFSRYQISTVYVDPPYTNAHYSRFYHIPETLVLYDYPEIEFAGRYRTDRYQSAFCIKSLAMDEFRTMLALCRKNHLNMVISYSDTAQCILSIDDIKKLCGEFYGSHTIFQNVAHMYRNFGQKPNKVLAKEYVITCYV